MILAGSSPELTTVLGKTTVTLGFMAALKRRSLSVRPFKVGSVGIDEGDYRRAEEAIAATMMS
jgi:cobyrinic acid a,c-diamide synthase